MVLRKIAGGAALAAALFGGGAFVAFAQTGATSTMQVATSTSGMGGVGTYTTTTVPTAPNTGAGGDAEANVLLIGVSAVIAVASGVYIARKLRAH